MREKIIGYLAGRATELTGKDTSKLSPAENLERVARMGELTLLSQFVLGILLEDAAKSEAVFGVAKNPTPGSEDKPQLLDELWEPVLPMDWRN